MHRTSTLLILLAGLLTLPAQVTAQDEIDFAVEDVEGLDSFDDGPQESPAIGNDEESLKVIYGDDSLFGTKLRLERHLGLYLVRYPQRDQSERVDIQGKDVTATVWVSIGDQTEDDLACMAVDWLVFGRTKWSLGARGIFSDFQDMKKVTVEFINVKKRDGQKERTDKDTINYLTVSLSRSRFEKLKPGELRAAMTERPCSEVAREFMTTYKFNARYYTEYQDDR